MDSTAHRRCSAVVAVVAVGEVAEVAEVEQVGVEQLQVRAHGLTLQTAREVVFATELGGRSRWAIEKAD
jgi:hypothetical protein